MREIMKVNDIGFKVRGNYILKRINFTVKKGEVIGLFGHNGAGKTTLHRILANHITPSEGHVVNEGHIQKISQSYNQVIYIPDNIILIKDLSVIENFKFMAKGYSFDKDFFEKYLEVLRINQDCTIGSLSKGEQEIAQLVIMLSLNATIYLLDEPFAGLDIFRRELFQKMLVDVACRDNEPSILLTTHLISEVENILTRVIYVNNKTLEIDLEIDQMLDESESVVDYLKVYFNTTLNYRGDI